MYLPQLVQSRFCLSRPTTIYIIAAGITIIAHVKKFTINTLKKPIGLKVLGECPIKVQTHQTKEITVHVIMTHLSRVFIQFRSSFLIASRDKSRLNDRLAWLVKYCHL